MTGEIRESGKAGEERLIQLQMEVKFYLAPDIQMKNMERWLKSRK